MFLKVSLEPRRTKSYLRLKQKLKVKLSYFCVHTLPHISPPTHLSIHTLPFKPYAHLGILTAGHHPKGKAEKGKPLVIMYLFEWSRKFSFKLLSDAEVKLKIQKKRHH